LLEEGKKNMEKAHSMGYAEISNFSLIQLVYLYIHQDDYQQLEWVYEKLTQFNPYNPRYFGGLAMVYKRNGKNEESKEAIKRILVIQSDVESIERGWVESQDTITSLLETIFGLKYNNPNYHKALYELQFEIGNLIEARKEARLYYGFYIQKPEVKNNPTLLNQAKKQLSDMLAKSSS